MIRGAVPGSKGGWVHRARRRLRRPPKDAPKPGAFKRAAAVAEAAAEGAGVMKADVTTLEAAKAGTVELADAIFGLSRAPISCIAWCAISS